MKKVNYEALLEVTLRDAKDFNTVLRQRRIENRSLLKGLYLQKPETDDVSGQH